MMAVKTLFFDITGEGWVDGSTQLGHLEAWGRRSERELELPLCLLFLCVFLCLVGEYSLEARFLNLTVEGVWLQMTYNWALPPCRICCPWFQGTALLHLWRALATAAKASLDMTISRGIKNICMFPFALHLCLCQENVPGVAHCREP